MAHSSIFLNPQITGNDNNSAGWYKIDKHNNNLALRVSSSNIGISGEIRFNKDTGIFQGFDGNNWVNFRDNINLNEQLQIPQQIAMITTIINEYKTNSCAASNLMLDLTNSYEKNLHIQNELNTKLQNYDDKQSITKNYLMTGNVSIGNAVILIGSKTNLAVTNFFYNDKNLNVFSSLCNIIGIVETIYQNGTCDVVIKGPAYAELSNQLTNTEFQKSNELKNGLLAILDSSGKIYQPTRKPLSDFIQIGFLLENTTYSIHNKMIRIWVEPKIHIL